MVADLVQRVAGDPLHGPVGRLRIVVDARARPPLVIEALELGCEFVGARDERGGYRLDRLFVVAVAHRALITTHRLERGFVDAQREFDALALHSEYVANMTAVL